MAPLRRAQAARKLAEEKLRTAEATLSRQFTERRIERVKNEYDAVGPGADKRRRKPSIERGHEGVILDRWKHLRAVNLARNLLRNFTAAKAIDHQLRVNVVGVGPRLMLHTADKTANEAGQAWFTEWAKDCDARDDTPWNELLGCVLSACGTDGGVLVAFDDFSPDADGKLLFWSTDQMVTVNPTDWKNQTQWVEGGKPMLQERGFVRDHRGRVVAYIVTVTPGLVEAKLADCTVLPRAVARFVKRPWRLNQLVPVPEYLPMVADMEDLYEGRLSELQTWKKTAKLYGWVKSITQEQERLQENGVEPEGTIDDASTTAEATSKKDNYEALESLTGGYTDYLDPDDEVHVHDPSRPNEKMREFFDHCLLGAGASLGLARAYTNLQAETSYTAFRGEMLMSFRTFQVTQKFLERRCCDWIATKSLGWGIARGTLALPAGWESQIGWDWPQMPILDERQEYDAKAKGLKTGALTWADILGPDWERKLTALAKQADIIRQLNLPLAFFETVAGAMATTDEQKKQETKPDEEK